MIDPNGYCLIAEGGYVQAFKPAKLLYSDYAQLPKQREQELQAEYVSMEDLVK